VFLPQTFKQRFKSNGEPTDEAIAALDDRVRDAMQGLLDGLRQETPGLRQRLRQGLRS